MDSANERRSGMARRTPSNRVLELEHSILRALCNRAVTKVVWDIVARELDNHHWQAPDHRVVYEALRRIRDHDPGFVRDQLPAQATRMGFPDVEWSSYFAPAPKPEADLEELIGELGTALADRP
jgi:hypothetical protein